MKRITTTVILLMASITHAEMNVSSLTWMTGAWEGTMGAGSIEEVWTSPLHNTIQASVRLSDDVSVNIHEVVVIREVSNGVKLYLQQWSRDFQPLAPATTMDAVEQTENSITFQGPSDAMPQKLTYRRLSEDQFEILVTMQGAPEITIPMKPKS